MRWRELSMMSRMFVILLPLGSVIALNWAAEQDIGYELRAMASTICLLAWIPLVLHVLSVRKGIPFMPLFGLIYALYYGVPIFLLEKYQILMGRIVIPDSVMIRAGELALAGLVSALVAYYMLPEKMYGIAPRIRINLEQRSSRLVMAWVGIVAVVYQNIAPMMDIPRQFISIFGFLAQLASFSIALLFYYQLKGQLTRGYRVFLWGFLVPTKLMASLSTGLLAQLMVDLLILLGTYWVVRHRYPWKAALACILIVVPFLGAKGEYRRRAWTVASPTSTIARSKIFVDVVWEEFQTTEDFFGNSYRTSVNRMNMLTTFGAVVYSTPTIVPYWEGGSYTAIYWMVIPRLVYPNKPLKTLGQDFGHRYGLLDKADTATSYNFPQLVEFYANFGPAGVVTGMFLVGFIYRILYFMLSHPDAGDGGVLLGLIIFSHLCNIESDFSLVFGNLVLEIISMAVFFKVFQSTYVRLPGPVALRWR